MSKKSKNKEKSSESDTIFSEKNVERANILYLCALNPSYKLKNLNQLLMISFFKENLINKMVKPNDIISFEIYGKKENFIILSINCSYKLINPLEIESITTYLITESTQITLIEPDFEKKIEKTQEESKEPLKEDVLLGGLEEKLNELIETVRISFNYQQLFRESGLIPVKGILIYGPSGVGKSSLLKKLRIELKEVRFLIIQSSGLFSKFVGEGEKRLAEIFQQAKSLQPSIIIFEDLHQICDRKDLGKETSQALIMALMKELDSIYSAEKVLVIATTNQITNIDMGLRRSGRLDKEIKIEIPQNKDRFKILNIYMEKLPHNLSEKEINELNDNMNGFTGSDILTFLRESLIKTLQNTDPLSESFEKSLKISKKTLENCLSEIQPSGLKDIILEIPKTLWTDIGGYHDIKNQIKQVVEWPLLHPEAFIRMGIKPSKGVLLYGPPGCSKTMIAKAIATESSLNFIAIKGPELFSKYVGDSEKAIRELYKRARLCAPAIVFFDEIDAIATKRSSNTDVSDRVLLQLLTEMDGIEINNVITIAATNRPDIIDIGLTRPGRIDHLIYVPPPDFEARVEILKLNIIGNKMPVSEDICIEELAKKTERYSGAEICLICREAGLKALSRDINEKEILQKDFLFAFEKVKPRITQETLKYYKDFEDNRKLL